MLIAYGGRNCWCFKDWMAIDMRVGKKASADISFPDERIVPAMCFEGANASGKTCGLQVLSFIYDFCLNSFQYPTNSPIQYDTYFHNEEKSEFYITFSILGKSNIEYTYELELDKCKVYSEKLTENTGRRRKILLRRKDNQIVRNELCPLPNGIIYKDTASFISTLIQYGVEDIKPFKDFFSNVNSNVLTRDNLMTDCVAQYYYHHPELHKRVVRQLQEWDTGIIDVKIMATPDIQGRPIYTSLFSHKVGDETKQLDFSSQSNGTKLLYNRLKDFFIALDTGGVLIFDEIDTHLHSELVPCLLDYFLSPDTNLKRAQIIFTSHSTSILDRLTKYRVYLFKKLSGESICYRIDELPSNSLLRNNRSLAYEARSPSALALGSSQIATADLRLLTANRD
ncbi:MAG: ATP-binding protein [Synergistaceae bacterium]|nr:ATP-binding protein [Synergistaceae bacterium]